MNAKVYPFKKENTPNLNMAPKGTLMGDLIERADIKPAYSTSQAWDALTNIYEHLARMLVDVAMEINSSIRLLNSAGVSNPEVNITVNGLKRDLASFTNKLVEMRKKHEGRTGKVADGEEYSLCLGIQLEYVNLNEEFRALLFQPLTNLAEYANVALQKLNSQNPNIVTDVTPKAV